MTVIMKTEKIMDFLAAPRSRHRRTFHAAAHARILPRFQHSVAESPSGMMRPGKWSLQHVESPEIKFFSAEEFELWTAVFAHLSPDRSDFFFRFRSWLLWIIVSM